MNTNIFNELEGSKELFSNYTDEEALRYLYAIGWYNNYIISNKYQLNATNIEDHPQTPSIEYCNNKILSNNKKKYYNYRSLHAKYVSNYDLHTFIIRTIYEACTMVKTLSNSTTISAIININLAKLAVNNDELYNNLKIEEHKSKGDTLIYIGVLAGYSVYVNLLLDEDDNRIFAFGNKPVSQINQYITTYIEYK